jgi:hypothetical protein
LGTSEVAVAKVRLEIAKNCLRAANILCKI